MFAGFIITFIKYSVSLSNKESVIKFFFCFFFTMGAQTLSLEGPKM